MRKFLILLVIVMLGCQDAETPTSPSMADVKTQTRSSNLSVGSTSLQSSMTDNDRKVILDELKRSGLSFTNDELDFLVQSIDAAIPVIAALKNEMPQSLRDASGNYSEIIAGDPEAAAFAIRVENSMKDKLTTEVPPSLNSCDTGLMLAIFLCLKLEISNCKMYKDQSCVTLGNLVDVIQCIYGMCHIDEP